MNKKRIFWLVLALIIIVISLALATYAYYVAKDIYGGSFDVDITSKGVDTLSFNSIKDISFSANSHNFSLENGNDVFGEGVIDINLYTTKNEANYCYEVSYILPDEPVFDYSVSGRPELLLDIYKQNNQTGQYEKIIDSLDVTIKTGIIKVPTIKDGNEFIHEIYTIKNTEKIESWKARLTIVYFNDVDQSINDEKTYASSLKVDIVDC